LARKTNIRLRRSATAGAQPTTSNLDLGEIALNTYDGKAYMKKSVGGTESIVEIGSSAASANDILKTYEYDGSDGATSNTVFSGADNNSETLSYTVGSIQVYLNGILLQDTTDYTASTGNSVTLVNSAANADLLQVIAWFKAIGTGDNAIQQLSGDGSTTGFTLATNPYHENQTDIFIDGIYQQKTTYSISGTTLTFSEAPPSGTNNIEISTKSTNLDTGSLSSATFSGTVTANAFAGNITGNVTGNTSGSAGTVTSLSGHDSDDLSEGSSNLYHTSERVDDRVNALLQAGSNISLSYDDSNGQLTITGTDTNTTYSAGTGLALSSTTFSLSHLGLQSLSDPNADRIAFWDDSAGAFAWLSLGTGLSLSGTTLSGTAQYGNSDVETYLDANGTTFPDNIYSKYGTGNDLTIRHTGSVSEILNYTGNLQFVQYADDADIFFDCDDGSGGTARYLTLDGSAKFVQFDQHTKHSDSIRADFGNSSDLQIYHDGSHSIIKEDGTGDLRIDGDSIYIRESDGTNQISAAAGTAILYKDGTARVTTTSGGATVAGVLTADTVNTGQGATEVYLMNQNVRSTDDVTFDDLTLTGNLTVGGTTTTLNTATLDVEDLNITVGKAATTSSATDGAGLTFGAWSSGTIPTLTWDHTNARFAMNKDLATNLVGNVTGNITGTVLTAAQGNITSLGTLTTLTVDDITINGSTISDAGDFTLDVGGDISLDADGGNVYIKDAGTTIGQFFNSGNSFVVKSEVNDMDLIFKGVDNSQNITALTLDMSNAGNAIFNYGGEFHASVHLDSDSAQLQLGDDNDMQVYHNGAHGTINVATGNLGLDVVGDIVLDAGGGDWVLNDDGTELGRFTNSSSDFVIKAATSDKDLIFKGNDGGSVIEAMRIDYSAGGFLGIGTTAPNQKLDVQGNIRIPVASSIRAEDDDGTYRGAIRLANTSTYNLDIFMQSDGSNAALTIQNSDRSIGIGTGSPGVSLDVGSKTDAIRVPNGTTAQRPTAALGQFRYNTTTSQFEGYTGSWGAIGGGGDAFGTIAVSGQSNVVADQENDTLTFAAGTGITLTTTPGTDTVTIASSYILNPFVTDVFTTANSSTTTFTLTGNPESEDMLLVFIEGVYQNKNSYALNTSTNVLTVDSAPGSGEEVVVHQVGKGVAGSGHTQDSFTGNGSTAAYTLSITPVTENDVFVYLDGVYQHKNTYSVSGTTLTFDTNVPSGVAIEAITPSLTEVGVPTAGSVTPAKLSTGGPSWDSDGNVTINSSVVKGSDSVTISSGSATAIATMAGSTYRSAKITAQVTDATASEYMVSEILLVHTGSATHITEYGQIYTGSAALGTFTADYNSGNMRLLYTRTGSNSQVVKVDISRLKV
jgi:hypothetical protein